MSEEIKLPDELAACEARLAALPLPAARVDRDELMFRAGWAAGHAAVLSPPLKDRKHWRSHVATAAVAASLAVAVTLGFAPHGTEVRPSEAQSVRPSAADAPLASLAKQSSGATRSQPFADFDDLLDSRDALTRGAPLMARQRFTTNFVATQAELDDSGPPARPATARRLLEDFAPREKAGASSNEPIPAWLWSRLLGGNTI
jgi:negative regulator of sigma E activity